MDMIERVAKAMWSEAVPNNPWEGALDDDYDDGPGRNTTRRMARAAIEAMREPTEAMASAFDEAWSSSHMTEFLDGWSAAIAAALATQNTEEK
jgi:hypothetical protein